MLMVCRMYDADADADTTRNYFLVSTCVSGRFVAVTHGEDERVMPGHALAMQADKPFRSLQQVQGREGKGRAACILLFDYRTLFL